MESIMKNKKHIQLKPVESDNPDTQRIYEQTREACDRLNGYLNDFIETIAILNEKKEGYEKKKLKMRKKEVESDIKFVESKIKEVHEAMDAIASEMDFLVELKEKE